MKTAKIGNCKIIAVMLLIVGLMPAVSLKAAEKPKEYTVTFRAGNAGEFDTDDFEEDDRVETDGSYIKITVEKGKTVAETVGEIWKDDSTFYSWLKKNVRILKTDAEKKPVYQVKKLSNEDGIVTKKIKRNTEYVLDYARIHDAKKAIMKK